jgi:acetyl esterase/lipase
LSFNYILREGKFYSFRGWDYLPAALIINGEFDLLHDEGEAYANHKLIEAGVPVTAIRYHGTIHDY